MKKVLLKILGVIIVVICFFFVYKVFFQCERVNMDYDSSFILKKYDSAKIDKTYYKLFKISNENCDEVECFELKNYYAKLLIINNNHISYIKLEKDKPQEIKKFDIIIKLIDSNSEEVKLKVNKMEKKNGNI